MKKATSLHTMTEYSFLQSVIRIDDLINFALANKLDKLVITDRNNMHGAAEFISKCKNNKIKPIVGIDIDIDNYRMILLAKNYQGYQDLMNLASKKAKNCLTLDNLDLLNIIAIDHPTEGYFAQTGLKISAPNYYIGTFDPAKDGVYFQETRALKEEDKITLQILDKLRLGDNNSINYNNFRGYQFSLIDSSAVQNTARILESCSLKFPKLTSFIPEYKTPATFTSITFLKKLVYDALNEKKLNWKEESIYTERLWHEIKIIENLQFENYFLVLWDLVKYALTQNILIGPGRGSAAGSLVAYLLKITEIDPIKHNLLFERFLNPERVSLPDIDIDIQDDRRIEIINYLFVKYSKENVALISTFQRLGSKSAIRDVARLKGISVGEAIEITKLIPINATLEYTYQKSSKFRAIITKSQTIKEVFELAKKIENLPRQLGTHAAGVVISNIKIENKAPTLNSSDGFNQIQFSMDHLENVGLLKIDLLGLRNLTILQNIKSEIFKNYKREIIWTKIPLNDKKTYDLLSEGRTNGIFQLESFGMKRTLRKVQVSSFYDVVAILSLYRPGPMDFINVYAQRKNNHKKIPKVTPIFDKVVQDTYGIMIYQEQVMQIAQLFAGMTFGQADILRRAISKKNFQSIGSMKKIFIDGAVKKGVSLELAKKVYFQIEAFANYGFNKSHAVAYATLSYRLAYLKANFPFEFYIALLNSVVGSAMNIRSYVNEARLGGIKIEAPNINLSEIVATRQKSQIVLPLGLIKGLGAVICQKIIEERQKGFFTDFFTLVARLKILSLGESIILLLIKSNALRDLGNMASLLKALPQALRYALMILMNKDGKKYLNYELIAKPTLNLELPNIKEEFQMEKTTYGFPLHTALTLPFEKKFRIVDLQHNSPLTLFVSVNYIKRIKDKNGNTMAILTISDSSGEIDAFVFHEDFAIIKDLEYFTVVEAKINYNSQRKMYNWVKLLRKDLNE